VPGSRDPRSFDLSLKNDYISPRGVLVTDTDRIVQVL
jgi:hypothetical protein